MELPTIVIFKAIFLNKYYYFLFSSLLYLIKKENKMEIKQDIWLNNQLS